MLSLFGNTCTVGGEISQPLQPTLIPPHHIYLAYSNYNGCTGALPCISELDLLMKDKRDFSLALTHNGQQQSWSLLESPSFGQNYYVV